MVTEQNKIIVRVIDYKTGHKILEETIANSRESRIRNTISHKEVPLLEVCKDTGTKEMHLEYSDGAIEYLKQMNWNLAIIK